MPGPWQPLASSGHGQLVFQPAEQGNSRPADAFPLQIAAQAASQALGVVSQPAPEGQDDGR